MNILLNYFTIYKGLERVSLPNLEKYIYIIIVFFKIGGFLFIYTLYDCLPRREFSEKKMLLKVCC